MNIDVRTSGTITILEPIGRITLGDGDQELGEAVRGLLADGVRQILINFSRVAYLDSSGIGELVGCYTSLLNRGGELKLCGMNSRTFDLMKLTSLHSVFDVRDTEAEALAAFRPRVAGA
jgi:anti-sigma B factor antagonist